MDYKKEYNSLVARIKKAHLFAQTDSTKNVLEDILPELRESEDERIRVFLLDYAIEMIAGLESDISLSTYDGIKGHDPDAEAELAQWQKARAYLEKQKDQKPAEKHNLAAQLREHLANTPKEQLEAKWKELEKWNHVGPTVEEYLRGIKPVEWSEEDKEKLKAICAYLRDYSRLAKLGDKLRFNEYCDFLKSLRPSWKPSDQDELMKLKYAGTSTKLD